MIGIIACFFFFYKFMIFYSNEQKFLQRKWESIEVGDIIRLHDDGIIPADILFLNSSDENGLCHVSTANLDGENNLKQKQVPKGFIEVKLYIHDENDNIL